MFAGLTAARTPPRIVETQASLLRVLGQQTDFLHHISEDLSKVRSHPRLSPKRSRKTVEVGSNCVIASVAEKKCCYYPPAQRDSDGAGYFLYAACSPRASLDKQVSLRNWRAASERRVSRQPPRTLRLLLVAACPTAGEHISLHAAGATRGVAAGHEPALPTGGDRPKSRLMAADVITLGEVAARAAMIEIRCGRCDRRGRLSSARPLAKHRPNAAIGAVMRA